MGPVEEYGDFGRNDFPVSGVVYSFTTLRPGVDNQLKLIVGWRRLNSSLPFCGFVLFGLVLMRVGWARRFQILVGLMVLATVFSFVWPTLTGFWSLQRGTSGGVQIIALLWGLQAIVQGVAVLRSHCKRSPSSPDLAGTPVLSDASQNEAVPTPSDFAGTPATTEGGPDHG